MRLQFILFLALLCCGSTTAIGFELQPLQTRNLSPAVIGFGLSPLDQARILNQGSSRLQANLDVISNFTERSDSVENLSFDGETYRLELALSRGIGQNFEIGITLPLVSHQSGFLDGFIEGWHDAFGLPQGGRDQAPRDQLDYSYTKLGGDSFSRTSRTSGIGDLSLLTGWQWWQDQQAGRSLALRASLKLPTGDSEQLLGSGSWDLALWLSAEQRWSTDVGELILYGGGGALYGTDGDLLPDQRRNLAATVSLGFGWQPWSRIGFQVQFDGHTALFSDSAFKELDQFAGQLATGGSLALGDNTDLEIAVIEDILVDTAPDVVFHFALRQRF